MVLELGVCNDNMQRVSMEAEICQVRNCQILSGMGLELGVCNP